MKVIMLSGKKGSGKDTVGSMLFETLPKEKEIGLIQTGSFAAAIKQACVLEYDVPHYFFSDVGLKEKGLSQFPVISEGELSHAIHSSLCHLFRPDPMGSGKHVSLCHTPRSLMVMEGEMRRAVDPLHWVKIMDAELTVSENATGVYIITDWRLEREYTYLKERGWDILTVRVEGGTSPYSPSKEITETELDNFDFDVRLDNIGSLQELKADVSKLWEGI